MHIEPLIKKLEKGWLWRILLYLVTNLILMFLIEIWKFPIWRIILIIFFMTVYIIAYENLGIMFDRIKNK